MDIQDRILKAAQQGYDEAFGLDYNPITYKQACEHNSGDSLKDHLVIELTERERGGVSDEEEVEGACDSILKSIECLESALNAVQGLRLDMKKE